MNPKYNNIKWLNRHEDRFDLPANKLEEYISYNISTNTFHRFAYSFPEVDLITDHITLSMRLSLM